MDLNYQPNPFLIIEFLDKQKKISIYICIKPHACRRKIKHRSWRALALNQSKDPSDGNVMKELKQSYLFHGVLSQNQTQQVLLQRGEK